MALAITFTRGERLPIGILLKKKGKSPFRQYGTECTVYPVQKPLRFVALFTDIQRTGLKIKPLLGLDFRMLVSLMVWADARNRNTVYIPLRSRT